MTREVSVIILYKTKDKTILLQKRTHNAPRNPKKWSLFGGGIEHGETPLEGVKRECYEELEYTLNDPTFRSTSVTNNKTTIHLYTEKYDNTQTLVLHEGEAYGWFTVEAIQDLDMKEHDKQLALHAYEQLFSTT